ncbi:cryptochrome/photolyase family protein [Sediminimonas qiaohouensis]|uniref:cryptochrome/photolyase family protein n=1 Tax=Sediminimonas qiaohouensis TaxID=552061 RepID=UPI00040C9812|nr:deoxyribodipyrimidine photo-lyase [Sediminimonas qiaohouensis]
MPDNSPTILWYRRDLRLSDHPALSAAIARGGPVIAVYVHDDATSGLGAAPVWRLNRGLAALDAALRELGSRLILRRGAALDVLREVIRETGAGAVYWTRLYDPEARTRDSAVKSALRAEGIEARLYEGHLMFEPWSVETKAGGFYKVFTPMWKAVRTRDVDSPLAAPGRVPAPDTWPRSDRLDDWALGAAMDRGAAVLEAYARPAGERAAQARLHHFMAEIVGRYGEMRDMLAQDGTSGLSEYLSLGEISPRQCWHAGQHARQQGKPGAEAFLRELVWREFAYHLMYHTPEILNRNWHRGWDAFPWTCNAAHPHVRAWQQGRTGVPMVDAAMREMYVTGRMHNRGRMIVASYLTKHLMTHWRIGQEWFDDCLVDWDPASNAMGWQWAAGSGPDAAPYFRVFNPATQLDRFDPDRRYVRRWVAEGQADPPETALAYFDAVPRRWALSPGDAYPDPVVTPAEGRRRALAAYEHCAF